ncbi:patatin-like phospholipase family protein [Mycolicibacterium litorale]|uniref:NTE family protein n=1 Tax=Mycolicibacterium litorale TaxID=758802 RepID=A0AAD1MR60_9MYCO|nr:patatin-like phospholipase family protein [Mycolicibacterium litorale]MCV7418643.1 patatin-like phospholipase family protein [Mycolicibacterium litorale]TDY05959.1 NTE family protein [Mycolicibacterium litorale]BBY14535.1 putative NTE family protein [Mycolicibacterium litorale]
MSKRVALVLGSGGARGYAHIGVIEELHSRGYEIVGISGSSMGALVGGLQAAGKLDEYAEWAKSLTQRAVLRLLDPSLTAPGVLRAEKILDAVRDVLGEVCIEDLPVPYTAVTTDLIAGRSVWLQRGPVDAAIRASIAIPGVITPHVLDGRLLADGGILDPLPMAPVAAVNADLTIAVSLGGSEAGGTEPDEGEAHTTADWLNRLLRSTSALLDSKSARAVLDTPAVRSMINRFGTATEEDLEATESGDGTGAPAETDSSAEQLVDSAKEVPVPRLGSFEVMNRTIDIAQAALARHTLAAYPPDLLVEVPRSACRSLDFHRAAEVIEVGRKLAVQALDEFERPEFIPLLQP